VQVQPLGSVYEEADGAGAGAGAATLAGAAGAAGGVVPEEEEEKEGPVMVMAAQFMLNSCSRLYQVLWWCNGSVRVCLAVCSVHGGVGWGGIVWIKGVGWLGVVCVCVCGTEDLPGKDDVAGRDVGWDSEIEGLAVGAFAAVTVRAVALVGGGDLEGLAGVDGEADLAGAAPVVADAGQAVEH